MEIRSVETHLVFNLGSCLYYTLKFHCNFKDFLAVCVLVSLLAWANNILGESFHFFLLHFVCLVGSCEYCLLSYFTCLWWFVSGLEATLVHIIISIIIIIILVSFLGWPLCCCIVFLLFMLLLHRAKRRKTRKHDKRTNERRRRRRRR